MNDGDSRTFVSGKWTKCACQQSPTSVPIGWPLLHARLTDATGIDPTFASLGVQSFNGHALPRAPNVQGTVGAEVNYVNNQVSYNTDKIDALNAGVGSLVDADLAKESAQLQALQIRQQLGTQALSIANQAPAALLSRFK